MILNKKDSQGGLDNFFLPQSSYRVRVTGTEVGESAKRNPMTTLTCEIIEPETIQVDGAEKMIAGRPFKLYLVHVSELVGAQRVSSQAQVFEFMEKLGLSELMEQDDDGNYLYDTAQHAEYFLGLEFDMILSSEQQIKRARPDKAAGERVGKPILDGEGKEITDGWRVSANISDVLDNCRPTRQDRAF